MIAALDAHAQAALVRSGEVPPTALVEAAIERIEKVDPAVNAVCHRAFDHALEAARSVDKSAPMAAVPCLLKASLEYPGFPMLSGSRTRMGATGKARYPLTARLDAAGLKPGPLQVPAPAADVALPGVGAPTALEARLAP